VVHRSHASSGGPQPGAAARPHARPKGLLALQRSAGNRAVRALLARDKDPGFKPGVVQIGSERVRVSSQAEKADAERIIGEMKTSYGVTFDSIAAQRTTRKHYGDMGAATDEQLKSVEARPWEYEELKAVERALAHFGPVLGERRKKSTLKSSPQEIATVGKLTTSPDDDPKHPEDKTRGEYFREAQTFALFEPGPDSDTSPAGLEGKAVHEIAHGVFGSQLNAFMKATGYWEKLHVKREKRVEGPPDGYADTNASEDLAQSVMYYFTDPKRLKEGLPGHKAGTWGNPCPKRFAFIDGIVGGWTAK
jgi:hypothetical protein